MYKKVIHFIRKHWKWLLLISILLVSFGLRLYTTETKWLLAYDPYFQFRHTKDVVEDGVLSSWDEFSYYPPGRPLNEASLMYYLTGYLFLLLNPLLGMSLMSFCSYMAAVYGVLAVIPAYFLGKEFSNKKAGILAAFFVGLSPAIITRTMGGFFDSDGLVIFFSLLSMYLLVRAFRKKTYLDYGLATLGLVLFGLTWAAAWYIPLIVLLSTITYLIILIILGQKDWGKEKAFSSDRIKKSLGDFKGMFLPFVIIFLAASVILWLLGFNALGRVLNLLVFAQDPSKLLIVNISVAELQNLDVFGGAWNELFARIGIPFIFTIPGALMLLRRDRRNGAVLLTWAGISFYAITRGIRFMLVFAPAACIASAIAFSESYVYLKNTGQYAPLMSFGFLGSILVSITNPTAGFVLAILLTLFMLFMKKINETIPKISKPTFLAAVLIAIVITLSQGSQAALMRGMSEPINSNWENAYAWLKDETAGDAVVGSWWDPGHRIAGIAERRNLADGAHCTDEDCDPGLNTRINHLGKIFYTDNETEAKNLLLKYRGNASEMYWIASDDLIGKFRWLQYFGTGCDGTGILTMNGQQKCPLYSQIPMQSYGYDQNYSIKSYHYGGGLSVFEQNGQWIVIMESNGENYLFQKEIVYESGTPQVLDFTGMNNTLPGTIWLHPDKSYLVFIPPVLENSLFTRMFFYEENETLENFELVFKNNQVKIYRLVM